MFFFSDGHILVSKGSSEETKWPNQLCLFVEHDDPFLGTKRYTGASRRHQAAVETRLRLFPASSPHNHFPRRAM
jgi:hypothetical protein